MSAPTTAALHEQLFLAVFGPYADYDAEVPLEDLIHKAGAHRRQIEAAHERLDTMGAPRGDGKGFTVLGRLERLPGASKW